MFCTSLIGWNERPGVLYGIDVRLIIAVSSRCSHDGEEVSGPYRRDIAKDRSRTRSESRSLTSFPQKIMKRVHGVFPFIRFRIARALLLSMVCGLSSNAFEVQAQSSEEASVFELSPFEVSATGDLGYMAGASLAGTRINTDLRDLGAAITVVTKEFLDDTGATGIEDLLVYTTGTEVGGAFGNFTGSSIRDGRSRQEANRLNPESNTRVRGLVSAELSRDYFITEFGFDSFNVERVDISRGPNSILFGVGSPGGVINYGLKRARTEKDFNEIEFRAGSYGSFRASGDFNKVIVPGRLAVRFNLLENATKYRQEPAYVDDTRVHVALEAVISKGSKDRFLGSLTLRGQYERADVATTPPNVVAPTDNIRDWYNVPDYAAIEAQTGQSAPSRYKDGTFVSQALHDRFGANAPYRGSFAQRLPWFITVGQVFTDVSGGVGPRVGFPSGPLADLGAVEGRIVGSFDWNMQSNLVEETWTTGFSARTFQGPEIYNFQNRLISGLMDSIEHRFTHGTLSLEQLMWKGRAGVELAYNNQQKDSRYAFPFTDTRSYDVWLDNNLWLGNREPNPNVGRPFMVSRHWGNYTDESVERDTLRATGFIKFDFRDQVDGPLGLLLGRHSFSGLMEQNTRFGIRRGYDLAVSSDEINMEVALNSKLDGIRRQLHGGFYIGPDLRQVGSYDAVRLNSVINVQRPKDGDTFLTFVRDPGDRQVKVVTAYAQEYLDNGAATKRVIDSSAVTWQSHLLDETLVLLLGYRDDHVRDTLNAGAFRLGDGSLDPASLLLQDSANLDAKGQTKTWSLVGHFPEKYLFELPFDSDLSLFYNESENFQPTGFRQTVFLDSISPPSGETKEYGFLLSVADRKFTMRVNWFETINTNVSLERNLAAIATDTVSGWLTRQIEARDTGVPFGLNSSGNPTGMANYYSSYDEVIGVLLNDILPEPLKSERNLRISESGIGLGSISQDAVPGLDSTSDYIAKGMEVEFVANPTERWRIALNIAKQETVRSGSGPELVDYYGQIQRNLVAANLWDTNVLDEAAVAGNFTFKQRLQRNILNPLAAITAKDGTVSSEQRKWRWNLVTAYSFADDTLLEGVEVGTALRWQDKAAVGYPLLLVNNDGEITQVPDLARPHYASATWNGDLFVRYAFQMFQRYDVTFQLNLRNVLGDQNFTPEVINPDGTPAVIRIPVERAVFLSAKIAF